MKGVLMDTNIYSWALRGDPQVVSTLQQVHQIGISTISIGELLSGFKGRKRERENRQELEEFLDSPRVSVYGVDENTAEFYAGIVYSLREKGRPIPTNDIWIASIAFQHGLTMFSKDQHFKHIPGILLIS